MEIAIAVALALGLGFVLGLVVGARRAFNLILSGGALRATSARIARVMPESMPTRSAGDILAGRVRVRLGGTTYDLPVLARAPSKRWLEQLDARFATLALTLDQAGTDAPAIMATLVAETDALYDMLLSYDTSGTLPPRSEIDEIATDAQILHAVIEVWRAAHPLAATPEPPGPPTSGAPSGPPSMSPPSTDGALTTSSGS